MFLRPAQGHIALVPLEEHLVRPARAMLSKGPRPLVVQELYGMLFPLVIPNINGAARVVVVLEETQDSIRATHAAVLVEVLRRVVVVLLQHEALVEAQGGSLDVNHEEVADDE